MGNIGGVQSGTVPATAAAGPEPLSQTQAHDLKATGFKFADKGGVSWDQWIDSARISKDPAVRAQYNELVELAGGRTDNASIKLVMERAQLMAVASRPGATASDQLAAMRGWEEQLTSALKFANPVDLLTRPVELAAQYLADSPGVASTEWGQSLQTVLKTAGQVRALREGMAEGIWEGGKSLVVGVVSMAAKTLRYGADSSMLGWAGDRLRGVTGKMPDWLEATVPSEKRGDATNAAISDMASGIKNYLANHTPAQVAGDIGTAIGKAWDGLKADHAKAAAQGPEAEARWWGKTIGRVGFEVAATFVPVAGQAGKVSTVARGADAVADGARAVDKIADAGHSAEILGVGGKVATGPWAKGVENIVEDGAFTQCAVGSCVSATGQILTKGAVSERHLLERLGEWSNPEALAKELNSIDPSANWKGGYFVNEADALKVANSGQVGIVLQAPGVPAHMVSIEAIATSPGKYLVHDTGAGVRFEVDTKWIQTYAAGGVWK